VASEFNKDEISFLVLTDIANLRLKNVTSIINYNAAKNEAFHTQRLKIFDSAQTQSLEMVMLMSEEDSFLAPTLEQLLKKENRPIPQLLFQMAKKRRIEMVEKEKIKLKHTTIKHH
jgi:superfamily II DNA/RNA helicase